MYQSEDQLLDTLIPMGLSKLTPTIPTFVDSCGSIFKASIELLSV